MKQINITLSDFLYDHKITNFYILPNTKSELIELVIYDIKDNEIFYNILIKDITEKLSLRVIDNILLSSNPYFYYKIEHNI